MPVTGLTLPFFSAGGTSLFTSMVAAGLLLNVARRAVTVPRAAGRRSHQAPAGRRRARPVTSR
jgi:cell division protein FtsW